MRKFPILVFLCLPLAACFQTASLPPLAGLPPAPIVIADKVVLDEQGALAVELAYQAQALTLHMALRSGFLKGESARRAASLDAKAYAALLIVRKAYDAGNARDYATALIAARATVADALALIKGATS
jgi:hypothetical protein